MSIVSFLSRTGSCQTQRHFIESCESLEQKNSLCKIVFRRHQSVSVECLDKCLEEIQLYDCVEGLYQSMSDEFLEETH